MKNNLFFFNQMRHNLPEIAMSAYTKAAYAIADAMLKEREKRRE